MTWILSITSMIMLWLMGNKSKYGPAFGILNQGLWIYWVIDTKQFGLLAGVIAYTVIHIRNLILWLKLDAKEEKLDATR